MTEMITLDLNRERILVFESIKTASKLERMMDHVLSGGELPPVHVGHNGKSYFLHPGVSDEGSTHVIDGGHHRAIVHYVLDRPMDCIVEPDGRVDHQLLGVIDSAWDAYKLAANIGFFLTCGYPTIQKMKIQGRGRDVLTLEQFKRSYQGRRR